MLRQVVKEDIFEEVIQGGSELISWNLQVVCLVTSLLPAQLATMAMTYSRWVLHTVKIHQKGGKLLQSISATNFARVEIYPHL